MSTKWCARHHLCILFFGMFNIVFLDPITSVRICDILWYNSIYSWRYHPYGCSVSPWYDSTQYCFYLLRLEFSSFYRKYWYFFYWWLYYQFLFFSTFVPLSYRWRFNILWTTGYFTWDYDPFRCLGLRMCLWYLFLFISMVSFLCWT